MTPLEKRAQRIDAPLKRKNGHFFLPSESSHFGSKPARNYAGANTNEWIDDYRARMMHPIQYHSCFISYSHRDESLARRLHADLQDKGVRCWFAPHDMHIGDKIRPRIDEAIHLQDKLLLILSESSVTSDWVEHEVETALARERREKRTILFPIRIDNAILERPYTGWAATVQNERHIGDFTGWKDHDHYQKAFEQLIRDLKKADEESA